MSVTASRLIDDECSFADRKLTYKARYEVTTNDREDAALTVLVEGRSATPDPLPAPFATFALNGSSDVNAFCQSMTAKRPDPKNKAETWHVDVEWSPIDGDPEDDSTNEDNPLDRPLRIDMEEEEIQEIVENGWNVEELPNGGHIDELEPVRPANTYGPITNSAGVVPGETIIRPRRVQVLVVRKNFATLDEIVALQQQYVDSLNEFEFYGAPPQKAIVRGIVASSEMFAGGMSYREVTFRIAAYEKGWNFELANCGFEAWVEDNGEWWLTVLKKRDERGNKVPISTPANLEIDGTQTPRGKLGIAINWRLNKIENFAGMGIGG